MTTSRSSIPAAIFLALWIAPASFSREGGYASRTSVAQGESIDFHLSTERPIYSLSIFREGAPRILMKRITGLRGRELDCDEPAYATGCGWPVSYTLDVPSSWPSGVYIGELDIGATGSSTLFLHFVVREAHPGSTSPILFVCATNTYNAYNSTGGKSLYDSQSSDGIPSVSVSYDRPYRYEGDGKYYEYEHAIVSWMERTGYPLEVATSVDLHRDPTLLSHYACLVCGGHDEYWSREMRDQVDAFERSGGNVAFLGGNTCWWQVRFSPDLRTMHCYKATALRADPFAIDDDPANDFLITTNWYKPPVSFPENSTTGLGWRDGGFHNYNDVFRAEDGFGVYRVYRTSHWAFAGTELSDGDVIGRAGAIVGYEVDGTPLEARDASGRAAWDADGYFPLPGALPYVKDASVSKTPENFMVLAVAPATKGHGVMGTFEAAGGGEVFNAGTVFWGRGLAVDGAVARITENVLNRFARLDPLVNGRPIAAVEAASVLRSDAGISVALRGNGADVEEEGVIGAYRWRSSVDGFLSNEPFFAGRLSAGSHRLFFDVRDGQGAWSDELEVGLDVPDSKSDGSIVLDDGEPGTSFTGDWRRSSASAPYGPESLYSRDPAAKYTFEISVSQPGRYEVFARWTEFPSRRRDVPVSVRHEGGSETIRVDQTRTGSAWRSLGTWRFGASATIEVTSQGGDTTCADAVKLVHVGA